MTNYPSDSHIDCSPPCSDDDDDDDDDDDEDDEDDDAEDDDDGANPAGVDHASLINRCAK